MIKWPWVSRKREDYAWGHYEQAKACYGRSIEQLGEYHREIAGLKAEIEQLKAEIARLKEQSNEDND